MNRRDMKKQVKKTIASFLVNALDNENHPDRPQGILIDEIKLDVFRDGYIGTEAEVRRLQDVLYDLYREAHIYEV